MKKTLSVILSLLMMLSVITPFSAFAEEVNNEVHSDMVDQSNYLSLTKLGVSLAVDAYTAARAGTLDDTTYFADLDKNLKDNKGKIVVGKSESALAYAAVINTLCLLGKNPANYNGYNLKESFEKFTTDTIDNPYNYRVVVEACKNIGNDTLAKMYIDSFIEQYYTLESGMNYWGYSCDNTAVFLTAIAGYQEDYANYVADAVNVIESYAVEGGYCYSFEYADFSVDSTAVALMAYAAIGDMKKAEELKALVMTQESETNNGIIMAWGSENAYATKEVLLALTYMHQAEFKERIDSTCTTNGKLVLGCSACEYESTKTYAKKAHQTYYYYSPSPKCRKAGVKITACENCSYQKKETVKALGDKYHRPMVATYAVKATYFTTGKTESYKCEDCGATITKAKTVAKKKPTISKLTGGKKSFKITTKKVDKATGYQIQYSRYSDFKYAGNYRTKYATKTISNLRANKKYYVRVRAYKTTNGKTVYSSWSASKTVKTK